jgi:1,4-dihydroxy-2-naphthoate polyprenyltransferase
MNALAAFMRLSRLKFLAGGFIGGALGIAVAGYERGQVDLRTYALAQVTITSAHLMTQYANEYYDQTSDALTKRTKYSGGSGVLVDGLLAPGVALYAALACLCVSYAGIATLIASGRAVAAVLGALCVLLAWAYSAPPLRLLARGLGEVDTVIVVAVLVPLFAYAAQTGALDLRAVATTLPGAVAIFVMMVCVQIPDADADAATGKRNLVVRLGTRRTAQAALAGMALLLPAVAVAYTLQAPAAYAVTELGSAIPIWWLATALLPLLRGAQISSEAIAERGVALFACVGLLGTAGYAIGALWH